MPRAIAGLLSYPTPIAPQFLTDFAQGEDVAITFILTSTVSPSSWVNVEFTLIPEGQPQMGRWTGSIASGQVGISNVAGSGPYTATVTVTIPHANTKLFGGGSAVWQCEWADSGNVSMLGSGEVGVTIPLVPIP